MSLSRSKAFRDLHRLFAVIVIACLLFEVSVLFFDSENALLPNVKGDSVQGWLDGWNYRKTHTINSATGAGADYNIRLNIHSSSGSDSGRDVYLDDKIRNNFEDLRFTASDGITPLDYWVEKTSNNESSMSKTIQASWLATDGTLYAGSGNVLYKSSDQGLTWQALKTFSTSICSVFVDRRGYVFASPDFSAQVNDAGLWRSVDNGQTWTRVLILPLSTTIWGIDENSVGTLFAGVYSTGQISSARIYRSDDGGQTWVSTYYDSVARHVHDIAVDTSNNYVYASIGDSIAPWNTNYVIRSTDNGGTWSRILVGMPQIVAIEIGTNSRLFATDTGIPGTIYRTIDDQTFSEVLNNGAFSYGFWMRTDHKSGKIFASFVGGEATPRDSSIYVSTNDGVDWSIFRDFDFNVSYAGSSFASNFVDGTMYYSVASDTGWLNGEKLFSDSATVWIKIRDNLSFGNSNIYIYYGNNLAVSKSNGEKTFPFFDDFTGLTLNTTKWNSAGYGIVAVSNGYCLLNSTANSSPTYIYSKLTFGQGYSMHCRSKLDSAGLNKWISQGFWNTQDTDMVLMSREGSNFSWTWRNLKQSSQTRVDRSFDSPTASYYSFGIIRDASGFTRFSIDNIIQGSISTNVPTVNLEPFFGVYGVSTPATPWINVDSVFVRKYVNPEPINGIWGKEETMGTQNDIIHGPDPSGTINNLVVGKAAELTLASKTNSSMLFSDDFSVVVPPSSWQVRSGSWVVENGSYKLVGVSGDSSFAYAGNSSWMNYGVEARIRYGSGPYSMQLGGRFDPNTGAHYGLWIYPSSDGPNVARLVKFTSWTSWALLGQASVLTDSNWHVVRMELNGSRIQGYYDGALIFNVTDGGLSQGVVCLESWGNSVNYCDWINVTSSVSSYFSLGTLVSSPIDIGYNASWGLIYWDAATPNGTAVMLRTRTADSQANLAAASWSNYLGISGSFINSPPNRWIQYEITLATNNTALTPLLQALSIEYS